MRFVWPECARSELRAINRDDATRILAALTRYGESGEGDVRALAGQWRGFTRLRVGDYRLILLVSPEEITVVRVRHRSDVYR